MLSSIRAATTVVLALGASAPVEIAGPAGIAVAQTTSPSSNPGAAGTPSSTQAPVGHRQPRPSDIGPENDRQKQADEREAAEQRRLDRVLRNICRGC
jgi:hypothetical protein